MLQFTHTLDSNYLMTTGVLNIDFDKERNFDMKIWFRVGMEAEISEEEMKILSGNDNIAAPNMMKKIIERAELSGETYIVGQKYGCVENYNNPEEEINFVF